MEKKLVAHTQRTIVNRISIDDAPFFVQLVNSPGWLRYIGDRQVSDVADAERFLEDGFLQSYRDNGFGHYLVRSRQGDPMGICGFLKKPILENPDFGFAFLPEYMGQGFAFEACEKVLKLAVEYYRFTILDAVLSVDNSRSKRLLEKLGFGQQGTIPSETDERGALLYRWERSKDAADSRRTKI